MVPPSRIYFLRHGQSTFNAAFDVTGIDPAIVDPGLTQRGVEQVQAAVPDVRVRWGATS